MSEIVQKIKHFVQLPSKQQGIKGLIKLQAELDQNLKYRPRVACLHLMEMTHDWQGIRKLVVEWKLARSFGRQLVTRMRKRVGQQPGVITQDSETILKELDRLFEKNWRQFSPKKNFPDYHQYLKQVTNKNTKVKKVPSSQLLLNKIQPKNDKDNNEKLEKQKQRQRQKEKEKERQQRNSNSNSANVSVSINEGGSIFSRLSLIKKNDNLREKQIVTKGLFSKQLRNRSQSNDPKQQSQPLKQSKNQSQPLKQVPQQNFPPMPRKPQQSTSIFQQAQQQLLTQKAPITPQKQLPKKLVSLKVGTTQRQKQSELKDQFSFSAVKAKQTQAAQLINSNRKLTKPEQLDQSFLNFTNQSKKQRYKQGEQNSVKKQILPIFQQFNMEKRFLSNNTRLQQNKPLLTEQQLLLIEPNIPHKNYIKNIFIAEGKSAVSMLRKALAID